MAVSVQCASINIFVFMLINRYQYMYPYADTYMGSDAVQF